MLYLNTTKKPFDDVNVRKALSYAIDRAQIVKVAMYDYTKPADVTGLSEAYPNYKVADPSTLGDWTTMNVDKANQMLDAAGLKKGGNGIRVGADGKPLSYEINVVSGWTDWVSSVQIIAQNFKAIGIDATVKPYDFSTWFDRVTKGNFDISIGWSSGGATPYNYYRDQMSQRSFQAVGVDRRSELAALREQGRGRAAEPVRGDVGRGEAEGPRDAAAEGVRGRSAGAAVVPGTGVVRVQHDALHGFPTKDNPYAVGSFFNQGTPEQLIVMTTIKPK